MIYSIIFTFLGNLKSDIGVDIKYLCIIRINSLYDQWFIIFLFFYCFRMTDYPKNQYFSNHSPDFKVQEFDNIYNKEITKRYHDYEIQRLSKRKNRKRAIGAGRSFKLDVKDRFLMLLVYYRLYITYTLAGFLFDLDQSNICRDIQKIEGLIRNCLPIPQKIYNITKRLQTLEEVEQYFPGFLSFIDSTEQQIPRPVDKEDVMHTIQARRKDIL